MKVFILFFSLAWGLAPPLFASIRIHRTDQLGSDSPSSPRFDHAEARAEARVVFAELALQQGWEFSQSSDSKIFTDAGLKEIDVIILEG